MNQDFELKHKTKGSEKFVETFLGRLEEITLAQGLHPGMLIAIIANRNYHGMDIPSSIINGPNYYLDWETKDDPVIVGEALKRIKRGKIIIDPAERYPIGEFILQYNFVRGFRPLRGAQLEDVKLDQEFGNPKFHYGLPTVDPEVFDTVNQESGVEISLIFNRYPFAPYHFLWVPNRKIENKHNQYLDPDEDGHLIEAAWDFVTNSGLGGGIRLCYNSNGAHASVNHLHFQGFFLTQGWEPPFEKILEKRRSEILGAVPEEGLVLNGEKVRAKDIRYKIDQSGPIDCYFPGTRWISKRDGVGALKDFIGEMNKRYANGEKVAFNLYMTPEGAACFPRKHQADKSYFELIKDSPFTTGYAFSEMIAEIICPNVGVSIFGQDKTEKRIREIYQAASLG